MTVRDEVTCPETGQVLTDRQAAYKHTVQTFHLEDQGPERLLQKMEGDQGERASRIRVLLEWCLSPSAEYGGEGGE